MPVLFPTIGPWYSTEEAAQFMQLSSGHVSRLCHTGELRDRCRKVGNAYLLHDKDVRRLRDNEFYPVDLANYYHQQLSRVVSRRRYRQRPRILGILAPGTTDAASRVYARTLQRACEIVGFELGLIENPLDEIEDCIRAANDDRSIHGIFIFYPIFSDDRDKGLRDLVDPAKDIEGLSQFWADKLYSDERFTDAERKKKAILPCTSLGILKIVAYLEYRDERPGETFVGKKVTVFNRSDVVGRPLAYMLMNDGATVFSFDIHGGVAIEKGRAESPITREQALRQSDIVITGVPSRSFDRIRGEEIGEDVTCVNFSHFANFDESAKDKAAVFVPRVGPMTIAMCIRNAIRLYDNRRQVYEQAMSSGEFAWERFGKVVLLAG